MGRNKYLLTTSLSTILGCLNLFRSVGGILKVLKLYYTLLSPIVHYLLSITKMSKGKNLVIH